MRTATLTGILTIGMLMGAAVLGQESGGDAEGCRDHPLFNRMPNYHIIDCESVEFDARKFPVGPPKDEMRPDHVEVEGFVLVLRYELNEGSRAASGLQILRNFENAARQAGASVEGRYPDWCTAMVEYDPSLGNGCTNWSLSMRFTAAGKETWAFLQMIGDESYGIQIVEREAMKQDIVVNAEGLRQGLSATGHVAVYDLHFDTGSAQLKPESEVAVREIALLLTRNPALKLHVVGHTDNVGALASNLKLSESRAAAVTAALVKDHGVTASRLNAFGAGPYAPVASNATEEGRAKNRRVELVEQ